MRRRQTRSSTLEEITLNMTPMIDMVFLLLIFFMFTATFHDIMTDKQVELPNASSALPDDRPAGVFLINIHKDDEGIFIDGRHYDEGALRALLEERAKENPEQIVVIRGDRRAFHRNLIKAMEACAAAGLLNVRIAATKEEFGEAK